MYNVLKKDILNTVAEWRGSSELTASFLQDNFLFISIIKGQVIQLLLKLVSRKLSIGSNPLIPQKCRNGRHKQKSGQRTLAPPKISK